LDIGGIAFSRTLACLLFSLDSVTQ
jgi:hypothetical protein